MPLRYLRIWVEEHNPNQSVLPLAYLIRGQTKKGVTHTLAKVEREPIDPRGGNDLKLHADLCAATYRKALVRQVPPDLRPRELRQRTIP